MKTLYCLDWNAEHNINNLGLCASLSQNCCNRKAHNIEDYNIALKRWKTVIKKIKSYWGKALKLEEDICENTISIDLLQFEVPDNFDKKKDNCFEYEYKTLEIGILCGGY